MGQVDFVDDVVVDDSYSGVVDVVSNMMADFVGFVAVAVDSDSGFVANARDPGVVAVHCSNYSLDSS